ncbi:hypothetical protein Era103g14 [Erwinia phage Era103]|uniref:Uncharacterized protein n=1 Tax=Erwinia phage Era103 TaxID=418443 RepID=A2I7Y2_9CAUD|nr:hypothetical protein Era103g14 [Erwinia phage Era103]ABM63404.1 hypothetical protein Era103g14 [Erwinia phage Era103]
MKVFKSRFIAYKFFKDGKRMPGLLTVAQGRLLPELQELRPGSTYIAGWPASKQGDFKLYAVHNQAEVEVWKKHIGADKVQRIIVEQEHVQY